MSSDQIICLLHHLSVALQGQPVSKHRAEVPTAVCAHHLAPINHKTPSLRLHLSTQTPPADRTFTAQTVRRAKLKLHTQRRKLVCFEIWSDEEKRKYFKMIQRWKHQTGFSPLRIPLHHTGVWSQRSYSPARIQLLCVSREVNKAGGICVLQVVFTSLGDQLLFQRRTLRTVCHNVWIMQLRPRD